MNILYKQHSKHETLYWRPPLFAKFVFQRKLKKKKNSSLTEQEKTFDRSDHILKRNMKFSNPKKRTKSRSMLPFQEGMDEMSHEEQNLILTSLQFPL